MGKNKIFSFLAFCLIFLLSVSAFAKDSKTSPPHRDECLKLGGGIFTMMLISGLPAEISGEIADKKIKDCLNDENLDRTINFIKNLTVEYLTWRKITFDCAFVIGKQSGNGQTINDQLIKDYEMEKISLCVVMVMKGKDVKNNKL